MPELQGSISKPSGLGVSSWLACIQIQCCSVSGTQWGESLQKNMSQADGFGFGGLNSHVAVSLGRMRSSRQTNMKFDVL